MWLWIHLMKIWSSVNLGILLSPIQVRMKIWLDVLISLFQEGGNDNNTCDTPGNGNKELKGDPLPSYILNLKKEGV